ncbi:MAG: molecular chaperone HtpG [Oscillospiraceae bacterium]|nr:molecular chaperone HtpG [Oscillospiraceae bacterium]
MAKKEFQAESKRLLDLMINSIYTHKEIFLREIISNASDAIDKLCYQSLTDEKVGLNRDDFKIEIRLDKDKRTITVSDNGIGMAQEDLENHLGTIARSGSYQFRREVDKDADVDIIGQFGVGFYSAFMIAEKITVITKKYGSDSAFCWESEGADGYTITPCERDGVGTDIIMTVKADSDEEQFSSYLESWQIYQLVKRYSDYIRWPIRMEMVQRRVKEGSPEDKPEYESVMEWKTLNSMVPLWQRQRSEVSDEEYASFYQEKFFDFEKPQRTITASVEGSVTYKALMFVPANRPADMNTLDFKPGLQLYSSGVMIMEHCEDLLPEYLDFVRGVVDSPDLSLNISRELLQHDRQLKVISNSLEKKIRGDLGKMLKEDRAGYEKLHANFGRNLKFGLVAPQFMKAREALQEIVMFLSSTEKKLVTFSEYVDRMSEEQKYIYYAAGESAAQLDTLPQAERIREKGWEILYFTDQLDELVAKNLQQYKGKELRSVVDGDLGLEDENEKETAEEKTELLSFVKNALGERVKEVRLSRKLKSHPVCLTAGEGLSFEMEKYMRRAQPEMALRADRILELNAAHPAVEALEKARIEDSAKAEKYAKILFDQAVLIAGLTIDDPTEYTDLVCELMK